MANILYARMTLQHTPLLRRILVLLVVALVFNAHLLPGAAAGPLKYSHSSLVSALTGRPSSPAYGSLSGGGGGLNAVGASLGDAVDDVGDGSSGVDAAAAAALEGPGGSGGEVLVPKTFPMSPQEPTCEQLRAMWIFSKRQSRAAEMTNEIPTYRDPFAYNIWEPYYSTTRSMGALRVLPRYGERSRSPVFGRVISREPLLPQRVTVGHRQRHYGGDGGGSLSGSGSRIYGAESKAAYSMANGGGNARRPSQYRYVGANGSASNGAAAGNLNSVAVQGSFQKLKELIWTERAKELTQQRRAEELAARAAVLKEIANGQNIKSNYKPPFKSESSLMDENRSPDLESYQHDGRMSIATGQSYVSNNDNNKSYNANNNNNRNYNNNNNKNDRGSNNKSQNNNKNSGNNNSGGGGNKEVGMYTSTGSGMAGRAAAGGNSAAALAGSSTRSFGASNANSNIMNNNNNNYRGQQKSSFSGNFGFNSGRSGRLTLPGGYGSEEVGREREHNYGIPKSYPVRPSHFRERNRSLFKQRTPADLFERDIRNPETMRSFRRKQSPSIGQLIGTLNRRNRVPGAGSYTGGDDPYSTSLADMFSTEPRLLGSDNALSSAGLLGLVDGIEIDDNNIEAFLDYIDPVVSLMAYTGNNGNEQSGELYDYSSYY